MTDIDEVPDFNGMYELYDPCTILFFWRNKHMLCDFGTGNNNKLNWVLEDKQELIDIIETIYRGAKKGRGLVVSPKGMFPFIPFSSTGKAVADGCCSQIILLGIGTNDPTHEVFPSTVGKRAVPSDVSSWWYPGRYDDGYGYALYFPRVRLTKIQSAFSCSLSSQTPSALLMLSRNSQSTA